MTQWTRTIGRVVTNAVPAWRQAMGLTNTVYEIGDLPAVALPRIVWPSAGAQNTLYTGTDANYHRIHFGYGGSIYVRDRGPFGTMVFTGTGEGVLAEQMTEFTLSSDSPTWDFFQQPKYAVGAAEAATMDADWYYSEADYAALAASSPSRIVPRGGAGEPSFVGGWDGQFPVGYVNYIIRRKAQTSYLGNQRPHFARYEMPAYIPPSMTGTGNGAIVVNSQGTIYGPFSQGPQPNSVSDAAWWAEVWPSGRRKRWLYAMDVVTRQWQRLPQPVPDANWYGGDLMLPHSAPDPATKRLYYVSGGNSVGLIYYADFTNGLAGMTMSALITQTNAGGPGQFDEYSNHVTVTPATGVLAGKKLMYSKNGFNGQLRLDDLGTSTFYSLAIGSLPPKADSWGFGYDEVSNRLIITTKGTSGVRSYVCTLPSNYTSAAAYTFTMTALSLAPGVSLESGYEMTKQHGDRNQFIPGLGVVLLTQNFNRMLAYRPA